MECDRRYDRTARGWYSRRPAALRTGIARGTQRSAGPGSGSASTVRARCRLIDENSRGNVQNVCADSSPAFRSVGHSGHRIPLSEDVHEIGSSTVLRGGCLTHISSRQSRPERDRSRNAPSIRIAVLRSEAHLQGGPPGASGAGDRMTTTPDARIRQRARKSPPSLRGATGGPLGTLGSYTKPSRRRVSRI